MSNLLHLTSDLGQRIKAARSDLPQTIAARQIGVSVRTLQAWEAGDAFPQWRHRERLSRWLSKHERAAA